MSFISGNKKIREFKLKLTKISHLLYNTHAQFFPGNNPGYYNDALGHNRLKRWYDRKIKFNKIEMMSLSLFVSPIGIHMVTQNSSDIFGWMFVLWGTFCTISLFWDQFSSDKDQDENITQLKKDHEELKKNFYELKKNLKFNNS